MKSQSFRSKRPRSEVKSIYEQIKNDLNQYVSKRMQNPSISPELQNTSEIMHYINTDDQIHEFDELISEWRDGEPRVLHCKLELMLNEAWAHGLISDEEYDEYLLL